MDDTQKKIIHDFQMFMAGAAQKSIAAKHTDEQWIEICDVIKEKAEKAKG